MTTQQRLIPGDSASLFLTALLALAPVTAGAVVLGEPVSVSKIGEPLRIEIPVLQGNSSPLGECLRLATTTGTSSGAPRLRNARLDVTGRGPESRLVLSHRLPSFEPVVSFAIEDICDSRLRREYTVLLAFPDTAAVAGETAGERTATRPGPDTTSESAAAPQPARRPRYYRRAAPSADTAATPSAAREATAARSSPKAPAGQDRLELGGGESETPGAGLRMSTRLGSLARIDSTSEAQREQLRREQSVIMAIDRTIVAQLELNERIRQLEAVQSRVFAEHKQSLSSPAPAPSLDTTTADTPPTPAQSLEPDHSVAEAWKRGTLTVGFLSLALAGALAWFRKRRQESPQRSEPESKLAQVSVSKKAAPRPLARRVEPAPRLTTGNDFAPLSQTPPAPAPGPAAHVSPGWEMDDDVFAPPISIAPIAPIAPIPPITPVTPAAPIAIEETAEEHESAIELAEIMMGFGRIRGAADTLAEFIASNPKRAVTPWLKLMEVYRAADLREEFDALAQQLNKTFNVKAVTWDSFDEARQARNSIEQMAHLTRNVQEMWGTRECQAYLEHLLRDNREGTREGFPLSVIDEILLLAAILEDQLGTYQPEAVPPSSPRGDSAIVIPPQPA